MVSVLVSRCKKQVKRNLATSSFAQTWPLRWLDSSQAGKGREGSEAQQQALDGQLWGSLRSLRKSFLCPSFHSVRNFGE